jgi:hypothetical protein
MGARTLTALACQGQADSRVQDREQLVASGLTCPEKGCVFTIDLPQIPGSWDPNGPD